MELETVINRVDEAFLRGLRDAEDTDARLRGLSHNQGVMVAQYRALWEIKHPNSQNFDDILTRLIEAGHIEKTEVRFRGSRLAGIAISQQGRDYLGKPIYANQD